MANGNTKSVIVIGGGVAGLNVVYELMKSKTSFDITCITKEKQTDYSTCGMPYVLEGVVESFDDIILHKPEFFSEKNVKILKSTEVINIDFENQSVDINESDSENDQLKYDYLVIATGRISFIPPIPGVDLEGVHSLMNYEDGERLQSVMDGIKHAVIIGGGLIGLEMAVAFTENKIDTTVVEVTPSILPAMLDIDMGKLVVDWLEKKNIKLLTNKKVTQIKGITSVESVILEDNSELPAELVLLSTGIRPNVELAKKVGLDIGTAGGIVTNNNQQVFRSGRSIDNVFALGDCVETQNLITNQPIISALASTAIMQVRTIISVIQNKPVEMHGTVNPSITNLGGLHVGSVGVTSHTAERAEIPFKNATSMGKSQSRYIPGWSNVYFKFLASGNRIIGAQIIGEKDVKERINALTLAIRENISIETLLHTERCYTPPLALLTDPMFKALKQLI